MFKTSVQKQSKKINIFIKLIIWCNSHIRIPLLRLADKFKKHDYIDSDPTAWIVASVFTPMHYTQKTPLSNKK